MSRTLVSLLALGLLASCGSKQKKEDGILSEKTLETTMGAKEMEPIATEFVEPEGCVVEVRAEPLEPERMEYMQATEGVLAQSRMAFGSKCGSALPVEINWPDVWLSAGFDADEAPGAVTTAVDAFLLGTKEACNEAWRDKVQRVVMTPTDTAERVGLCFDEGEGVLVYRFMLTPGDGTATSPDAATVTGWYAENF